VIVPLIGFHMPKDEIELDGVRSSGRPDRGRPVDAIDATRSGGRESPASSPA
jgi:hypothetical protein